MIRRMSRQMFHPPHQLAHFKLLLVFKDFIERPLPFFLRDAIFLCKHPLHIHDPFSDANLGLSYTSIPSTILRIVCVSGEFGLEIARSSQVVGVHVCFEDFDDCVFLGADETE